MTYDRFGPYTVYDCLGAGGMASVHHAMFELADGMKRDVALKRLLPQLADDKQFVEDFIREAKLAAQLHHPNIVKILELGRIGRTYYIAMELVRGHSLMSVLKKAHVVNQPAPIGVAVSLMSELCDALDYVSNTTDDDGEPLQIVHRDLSPSNLLVTDDGHLKVIDFGVAKAVSGKFMTNTGLIKGKLAYMSSEALDNHPLDARADIYSVGVVMWELLAGRRLFRSKDEEVMLDRIRNGTILPPSVRNPSVPTELDEIVMTALQKDREARWRSAGAMREALEEMRRYYGQACTPREVSRWKRKLRRDSSVRSAHEHTEDTDEATAMRLSTSELEDSDILSTEQFDEGPITDPHQDFHEKTHDDIGIGIKIYFNEIDLKS